MLRIQGQKQAFHSLPARLQGPRRQDPPTPYPSVCLQFPPLWLHTVHTLLNEYMNFGALIPKFTTQVLSHPRWRQECLVHDSECVMNVTPQCLAGQGPQQDPGPLGLLCGKVSACVQPDVPYAIRSHEGKWLTIQKMVGPEDIKCCKSSPFYVFCQITHRPPVAGLHREHQLSGAKAFIPLSLGV